MTAPQDRTVMAPAPDVNGDKTIVGSPVISDALTDSVPGDVDGTSAAAISTPENTQLEPVSTVAPVASESGSPVAKLQKIEGMSSDIEIEIGTLTIGRKPGNDLALPLDSYISGRHAEIRADASGVYLTDVGSTKRHGRQRAKTTCERTATLARRRRGATRTDPLQVRGSPCARLFQ